MSKIVYCFVCESWHAGEEHKATRKADRERIATRSEARARLLEWLAPGSRVATLVRHVSRSGMQREISLYVATLIDGKPEIMCLDYWASRLLGHTIGKHGGIVVGGCGMDMGFKLVYDLGCMLWPNGTDAPHGRRNGEPDTAGGYALKHDRGM